MRDTILKAAKAAHEVNRIYCEALGDNSQMSWEDAKQWQRDSAIEGVEFIINNPNASPSAQHDAWLDDKIKKGWVYGKEKDAEFKTHPCIVEYDQLPVSQRMKDTLFQATVRGILSEYM